MSTFASQLAELPALNQVTVPDLWQQQAVTALREGKDVVVQAPTGAGKTLIFELWSNQGKNRGQAIYTVPTRALANDKLAEWRARGWDVGIATGDLAENLGAPVLVATLETQKNRLIQGDGPGAAGGGRIPDAQRPRPRPELRAGHRAGAAADAVAAAERQRGQSAGRREMAAPAGPQGRPDPP